MKEPSKPRPQAKQVPNHSDKKAIDVQTSELCKKVAARISGAKGNVALFLGAGASKTFGFPLTSELLPKILVGLYEHSLFEDIRINTRAQNEADRRLLKKTLIALCPGIKITSTITTEELPLVTSLLSMLDFSLNSGQAIVRGQSLDHIRNARMLLERAIYETIEHQDEEVAPDYWPPRQPNKVTRRLVLWMDDIRPSPQVGVITSNYDVAIEKAWKFQNDNWLQIDRLSVDFGFDWTRPSNAYPAHVMQRPSKPLRQIFKLHGSTNWLRCGLCDRVYINPQVGIAIYAYERKRKPNNSCHCGHSRLEVQIVSPSFIRELRAPNLISVWQHALKCLRDADEWVIIGYSFPDEDLNIRSLFARALASRDEHPHITAVQLGDTARPRYAAFFPKGNLDFINCGLEVFLNHIK